MRGGSSHGQYSEIDDTAGHVPDSASIHRGSLPSDPTIRNAKRGGETPPSSRWAPDGLGCELPNVQPRSVPAKATGHVRPWSTEGHGDSRTVSST